MTFEDLWNQICNAPGFPEGAKKQLPESLSDDTKKLIVKRGLQSSSEVVLKAINEINNGSVERIDVLVNRQLRK